MKYLWTLALATLVAARPIVDVSGRPTKEDMYTKRQGNCAVIDSMRNVLTWSSYSGRDQRTSHGRQHDRISRCGNGTIVWVDINKWRKHTAKHRKRNFNRPAISNRWRRRW